MNVETAGKANRHELKIGGKFFKENIDASCNRALGLLAAYYSYEKSLGELNNWVIICIQLD